jgi:hypothetical protein
MVTKARTTTSKEDLGFQGKKKNTKKEKKRGGVTFMQISSCM